MTGDDKSITTSMEVDGMTSSSSIDNDPSSTTNLNDNMDTTPTPPPRLIITKMVLENFKSYAGIKTIGPFHKCFSAVVGPNGSGKSNVIDAMLFVFGKRAKKLRLNKVSELIHSSAQFKDNPLTYAKVSVHFQEIIDVIPDNNGASANNADNGDSENSNNDNGNNGNAYTVVPNSSIIVTRIATRDNSSQYKLNGKNCSFRQVAAYLNSKGIDLDNNRFLILQGEVEMISMMPPKGKNENEDGLLEYLEDIIGSNKYVDETNEAAEKVEALTESRQEKLNRVKAVEKEKDSLEGAKLEAEALLNKEREIRRKKNILYQINHMNVGKELNETKEQNEALKVELEQERVKLQSANDRVQEIESGLSTQNAEYEKAHAELVKTKEEFASYERRDIQLREEIKHEKANKKKLQLKVQKETVKEEKASSKVEEIENLIPELENEIEVLTEQKKEQDATLETIFEESKGETETLRQELKLKKEELAPVIKERTVFQTALDTAMTEVQLLEDSTTRAKEQVEAAEKELAEIDSTQETKKSKLAEFVREMDESKKRVVDAEKEEIKLCDDEKSLAKRNAELTAQVEETKASLQSSGSRSHAVNGILKASRRGQELGNVGVLGRLGDLATISEQYDVAVSTACGMLDHIVVQTTAGAQRCLEFLRKHRLGRANFIPLDKMKKGAHDRAVDTPEGAPRLFDLIAPSNFAITPALYLGVGNTLVAPDLETATRWAYEYGKRWRVVTIDGNLIEVSGTMQGGGKSVRRGGMRLRSENGGTVAAFTAVGDNSEEECAKMEALATKAMQDLRECRDQRRRITEEIRGLKKRIKTLSVQIPKLSMEITGCDTTREELNKRIPELRAQCTLSDTDSTKLIDLNGRVKKCREDMSSCASLASELETDVKRLQKAILDAGGSRLKKQQKLCKKTLESLNETTKNLNSTKVQLNSSNKAIENAKKAKESCTQDLEKSKTVLQEKKDEFKKLEDEALEVMQAYEEVQNIESEKKEALVAVSKECEALKKIQSNIKCIEVDMMSKLDNCEKSINELIKRMKHWEDQIQRVCKAEEQDDDYDQSDEEEGEDEGEDSEDQTEDMEEDDGENEEKKVSQPNERRERETPLPVFQQNALEQYDRNEVKEDIAMLEKERDSIAKNANMAAIAEYKKKENDYLSRVSELDEVTETRNEARKAHEDLRRLRLEMFMDGFGQITLKLKEMYQMITLGGDAELELVDSLDPFSEGIVFSVRPPKKSWKNISNLSGGEKTLSSLALVFALHHYKPTPLYVMDEIDAALDFRNVSIVANYIKDRTKNAQFIIISLRNNMFELADRLVGIYKTHNCTKSITIDPKAFSNKGSHSNLASPLNDCTNSSGKKRSETETARPSETL